MVAVLSGMATTPQAAYGRLAPRCLLQAVSAGGWMQAVGAQPRCRRYGGEVRSRLAAERSAAAQRGKASSRSPSRSTVPRRSK